jgi:hypothetical protein
MTYRLSSQPSSTTDDATAEPVPLLSIASAAVTNARVRKLSVRLD